MSTSNIKETAKSVEEIRNTAVDASDEIQLLDAIYACMHDVMKDRIQDYSDDQMHQMFKDLADRFRYQELATNVADQTASRTLAAVHQSDWWQDKILASAVDTVVKAGVAVGGAYLMKKVFNRGEVQSSELPNATIDSNDPFSNPGYASTVAAPRSLRRNRDTGGAHLSAVSASS